MRTVPTVLSMIATAGTLVCATSAASIDPVSACINEHPTTPHAHAGAVADWVRVEFLDAYVGPVVMQYETGPDELVLRTFVFPNHSCTPITVQQTIETSHQHRVSVGGSFTVGGEAEAEIKASIFATVKSKAHASVTMNGAYDATRLMKYITEIGFVVDPGRSMRVQAIVGAYEAAATRTRYPTLLRCERGESGITSTTPCGTETTYFGDGVGSDNAIFPVDSLGQVTINDDCENDDQHSSGQDADE